MEAVLQNLKNKSAFAKRSLTIFKASMDNHENEPAIKRKSDCAEKALFTLETLIENCYDAQEEMRFEQAFKELSELQVNFSDLQTKFNAMFTQTTTNTNRVVVSYRI